jgi:hypothetical protein
VDGAAPWDGMTPVVAGADGTALEAVLAVAVDGVAHGGAVASELRSAAPGADAQVVQPARAGATASVTAEDTRSAEHEPAGVVALLEAQRATAVAGAGAWRKRARAGVHAGAAPAYTASAVNNGGGHCR